MSYKVDRFMSLGSDCKLAFGLRELKLREPGPVDWVYNNNKFSSICQLFTGDLFNSILNKNYFSRTYDNGRVFYCNGAEEFWYLHEDLNNIDDYKKIIYRFGKFEEHLRRGGRFIYMLTPKDTSKKIIDTLDTLNYILKSTNLYERILFISTIKLDDFIKYKYVTNIDSNNYDPKVCADFISKALLFNNWL